MGQSIRKPTGTTASILSHFDDGDSLAHYGVKGMKWGVRKDRRGKVKPGSVLKKTGKDPMHKKNKVSKKDAIREFNEKRAPRGYDFHYENKPDALRKTMLKAQPKIKKEIRQLNKSDKYKDADLRTASKLRDQYYKDVSDAVTKQLNASADLRGASRNRKYKLHFEYDVQKDVYPEITIRSNEVGAGRKEVKKQARQTRKISHSEEQTSETAIKLDVKWSSTGHIEDISLPSTEVEHGSALISNMLEDDALAHHGVKGMKWGVRKSRAERSRDRKRRAKEQSEKRQLRSEAKVEKLKLKQKEVAQKKKLVEKKRELARATPTKAERKLDKKIAEQESKMRIQQKKQQLRNEKRQNGNSKMGKGEEILVKFAKDQGKQLVKNVAQDQIQKTGKAIINSYLDPYSESAIQKYKKKGKKKFG